MQYVKSPISTICLGQAASMGALLLTAGATGKRFALPNARVMIHQPMGGFQGQATEIDIHAREILKIRERLNEIMAHHTGQPLDKIADNTERDYFLSAEEAKDYGLIDEVIVQKSDKRATKTKPSQCSRVKTRIKLAQEDFSYGETSKVRSQSSLLLLWKEP